MRVIDEAVVAGLGIRGGKILHDGRVMKDVLAVESENGVIEVCSGGDEVMIDNDQCAAGASSQAADSLRD